MHAPALPEKEALLNVMAEFADAIATGRPAAYRRNGGLRVLTLLEAASRSAENGGVKIEVALGGDE